MFVLGNPWRWSFVAICTHQLSIPVGSHTRTRIPLYYCYPETRFFFFLRCHLSEDGPDLRIPTKHRQSGGPLAGVVMHTHVRGLFLCHHSTYPLGHRGKHKHIHGLTPAHVYASLPPVDQLVLPNRRGPELYPAPEYLPDAATVSPSSTPVLIDGGSGDGRRIPPRKSDSTAKHSGSIIRVS